MKKLIAGLAVLGILAGCSNEEARKVSPTETVTITVAPTPPDAPTGKPSGTATAFQPNEQGYIREVKSRNIPASALEDQALLDSGYAMCESLDASISVRTIISTYLGQGVDAESTGAMLGAAVVHLCPKHMDSVRRQLEDIQRNP